MNFQLRPDLVKANHRLPFECVALLLQGGGALGAYQGGVYEALAEADIHPNWIAGISIGAINAAIIAGNPPDARVNRLREFWVQVTSSAPGDWSRNPFVDLARGEDARNLLNQMSANLAAVFGAAGFFSARPVMPWPQPGGSLGATSFYDTKHLKHTLERLVDFDRLNAGMTRFSAGAVNVRTGNFVYFDTTTHTITPEHVMASGALPPGFPAVEIDGEHYWDGGLVSNTPLQWVIESNPTDRTRSPSRSISGAPRARSRATWRRLPPVRRKFSSQAARERAPPSSRMCTASSVPLLRCCAGCLQMSRVAMI